MSHDAAVTDPPTTRDVAATPDEPRPSRWDSRQWLILALVIGFVLQLVWRLWLVRGIITPAAHADEDGYLVAARALAGGAGGYSTENDLFRRVGYPLLISPIYWFTHDPFQVYRAVHVINAIINTLTYPLAYLFARRVFSLPRGWSLGGAFAVSVMPAVAFYGQFAMADAVLATFGLAWLLMVHATLTASTRKAQVVTALGAGGLAGLMYVIHIRCIMVALAHILLTVAFLLLRRISWRRAAAMIGSLIVVGSLDLVLKAALGDKIIMEGNNPGGTAVSSVTTLHGIGLTAARLIGQLWYLTIGSWGLGAVGLAALLIGLWPLLRPVRPLRGLGARLRDRLGATDEGTRLLMTLTVLVTTIFVAFASSATLPQWDNRINYYAYPRYIHFLFPVWVIAGLAALRGAPLRRLRPLATVTGVILTGSAAVTYLAIRMSTAYRFLPFDSPETSFLCWNWKAIEVVTPTLVGMVLLGLLFIALPRGRNFVTAAMVGVIALNVAVVTKSRETIVDPMVVDQYRDGTPQLVRDAGVTTDDTVAVSTMTSWYLRYNHMREVWWQRILLFDSTTESAPAEATIIVAPYNPTDPSDSWEVPDGYELVVTDEYHGWAVWRKS